MLINNNLKENDMQKRKNISLWIDPEHLMTINQLVTDFNQLCGTTLSRHAIILALLDAGTQKLFWDLYESPISGETGEGSALGGER